MIVNDFDGDGDGDGQGDGDGDVVKGMKLCAEGILTWKQGNLSRQTSQKTTRYFILYKCWKKKTTRRKILQMNQNEIHWLMNGFWLLVVLTNTMNTWTFIHLLLDVQ